MNPSALVDYLSAKLNEQSEIVARENGRSRDRTLDQYRYQAGVAYGFQQASEAIINEYKRLLADDDE